jgi:hypothetical protein
MNPKLQHHFGTQPIVWTAAWGLSKLRKRGGRFAGAIPGDAAWYDRWYARVLSPETARRLADVGVNLVILPFSLGGDAEIEKEERDDFARMTAWLHAEGIRSLPYVQFQNILQEGFQLPGAVWAERLNGARAQYTYWRRTVCQSCDAFMGYFKALFDDALARGGDGVWVDNTYLQPCRCPECVAAFKRHLGDTGDVMRQGVLRKGFDHVELPTDASLQDTGDPIVQAFLEFNCARNLAIHRTLKKHLETRAPMGLYASNPTLYRQDAPYAKGVDVRPLLALHDLVYLENALFPGTEADRLLGNYHGLIACTEAGVIGIPGAWKPTTRASAGTDAVGLPENGVEVARTIYESAACGGAIGLNWLIRARTHRECDSADDLLKMYFERPDLHAALKEAVAVVRRLPITHDRVNLAETAVLYHRESLKLFPDISGPSLMAAEELLFKARMPYATVFSEDGDDIRRFALLVLPDVLALADEEARRLHRFVQDGGRLLILGGAGSHDERKRLREDSVLVDVTGASLFGRRQSVRREFGRGRAATVVAQGPGDRPMPTSHGKPHWMYPAWDNAADEALAAIEWLRPEGRQVHVEGAGALGVTYCRRPDGLRAVAILSYEDTPGRQEIVIRCRDTREADLRLHWHTPEATSPVQVRRESDGAVRVPFAAFGVLTWG